MTPKLLSIHAGRQPARLIFALLAAAVLLLAQQPTPANAYPLWTSSMVAGLGEEEVGGPLDLKFDAAGNPYLAIGNVDPPTDLTRWGLLLAEWDGSAWRTSRAYRRATCIGYQNSDLSLAVSADGRRAAISFWESCDAHFAVLFGMKSSEGNWDWKLTELPYTYDPDIRGGDFYLPSAVAFDSNGWAYLIFGMDLQVYFSAYSPFNTGWSERQPVTDSNHSNRFYWLDVSLTVDADNMLHAAFSANEGHSALTTYAYQNISGDWVNEDVAAAGGHHSLALDSLGRPRIAFHDSNAHSLKYARRTADGWNITTVDAPDPGDTVGDAGLYPSLTIDATNSIHISYIYDYAPDSAWGTVRYAAYAVHGDGWQKESVDFISNYKWTALALDNAGTPHVTYIANEDVFYATRGDATGAPPPDTYIDSGPARVDNESPVTFTFHSDDPAATFECLGPSTSFVACTSPHTWAIGAGPNYTFWVRAVSDGQADPSPAFYTFTRDMIAPDSRIISGPATDSPDPTFTFTANEPSTFQCRISLWKDRPPGYVWPAFQTCTSPKTFTGVDDGSWVFELMATDAYGNAETYANGTFYYWTLDQIGPPTTITGGKPAAVTTSTTATFSFSSNDTAHTFECQFDGGGFAACASPQSYNDLAEGSHTFQVRAIDRNGFADPTPAGHTWTVDTVVPDTTLTDKPANLSRSNSATFTFSSGESAATFECQFDGGDFAACASPQSYSNLADGSHSFSVRAKDAAGNVDPSPATYTWIIDTVVPDTTLDATPPNPSTSSSATFAFSSSDVGVTFACKLDNAAYGPCTSPKSYSGLADGSHTFTVRAGDAAGNLDLTPAVYTWTLDATPPETTITAKPAALSNDPTPDFAFTSSEGNYAAGIYFYCQTDANAWVSCGGDSITYFNLFDGDHTFRVKAEDTLGNVDPTPATWSWTMDLTAPETTITVKPAAATSSTNATFEFTSSEAGTFECKLDGGSYAACTSPKSYTGLSEAGHTFQARATDTAGNVGNPAGYTWTIDTTPPDTTITAHPDALSNSATASFSFNSNETGSTFQCALDGAAFAACASPKSYTGLNDGSHTFQVKASDGGGLADPTPAVYTWSIDATPPDTTITAWPATPSVGNTAVFTFSSETGATFECRLDSAAFATCTSPQNYTGLSDGSHTFQVRARDAAGNVDPSPASYTWTIDTTPPETTLTGQPPATTNSTDATFTFSSEAGATFECKLDSAAFAACTSPQNYTGLNDGSHTFQARAKDAAGNVDPTPASHTWTIDTPPDTTIDTWIGAIYTVDTITIDFSSSEANSTFACRLDSGGWAACVSPITYNALADGPHTFAVQATDAAGNTDPSPATADWTVQTPGPDTSLDSFPPDPSTSATATFTFSSAEATQFECSLDAAAFAACTSPHVVTNLADGLHFFLVRAVNAQGRVDDTPAEHWWFVDATPPAVTSNQAATQADPTNAGPIHFIILFTEPVNDFTNADVTLSGTAGATTAVVANLHDHMEYDVVVSGMTGNGTVLATIAANIAHDAAGNGNTASTSTDNTVTYNGFDTTPPDTTLTAAPDTLTNNNDPSFSFSSNEPGSSFTCQLDSQPAAACTTPQSYTDLSDGPHTFTVFATDAAGNADPSPAGHTWTIDTTGPDTTINSGPSGITGDNDPSFEFSSETGATFECRLDSGAWASCTSPKGYTDLADGPHTFRVRATDDAGNTGPAAERAFTVDSAAPTVSIDTHPPALTNNNDPSFTFSGEAGATLACKLDGGAFAACDSPESYTDLADGEHTFTVWAIDAAGNTAEAAYTWTIDTTPPATTITAAPPDPSSSADASFTFTSEPGAAFECRLDGGLWGMCASPRFYGGLSEGSHTFEVRASDLAGNTGPAAGHTWTIDLPAAGALYVTARGGSVPGAGAYQKNDILKWNGSAWSIWFDGATAGLPATAQIAAFDVDNDAAGSAWVVIRQAMKLPGVGKMQPYQIAYYNGSTWSRFFDGGDVGLKTTGERINGLEVLPGSASPIGTGCQHYLLISTVAGGGVPIGNTNVNFTGEDVLGFCMTQGGANTAGTWHLLFEGQSEGLQKNNNLGLSANADATTLYFTVKKNFTGDGELVKPSELFSFSGGTFSGPLWKARDHGLMQVVDGIDVVGMFP